MSKNTQMFSKIEKGSYILLSFFFMVLFGCSGMKSFRAEMEKREVNPLKAVAEVDKRRLALEIKSFLGAPYLWGGASPRGTDCSGFVMAVFKNAMGLNLPHSAELMYNRGREISEGDIRFGDLIFFKDIERPGISHVGIYLGGGKFAHASPSEGVTISSLGEAYYRHRYVGAKRIVGN